jgi:hypothetical protein
LRALLALKRCVFLDAGSGSLAAWRNDYGGQEESPMGASSKTSSRYPPLPLRRSGMPEAIVDVKDIETYVVLFAAGASEAITSRVLSAATLARRTSGWRNRRRGGPSGRPFRAPSPAESVPSWRRQGVVLGCPRCRASFPVRSLRAHRGVRVWAALMSSGESASGRLGAINPFACFRDVSE